MDKIPYNVLNIIIDALAFKYGICLPNNTSSQEYKVKCIEIFSKFIGEYAIETTYKNWNEMTENEKKLYHNFGIMSNALFTNYIYAESDLGKRDELRKKNNYNNPEYRGIMVKLLNDLVIDMETSF